MVLGQYFAFPATGGRFRPIFITEDATTLDDGAANHGEVPAACSRSMAWDLGFQDADHGPSWCRPWRFMVSTMDFHGEFSWCRPWIFMVSTMDHQVVHGTDHGIKLLHRTDHNPQTVVDIAH